MNIAIKVLRKYKTKSNHSVKTTPKHFPFFLVQFSYENHEKQTFEIFCTVWSLKGFATLRKDTDISSSLNCYHYNNTVPEKQADSV